VVAEMRMPRWMSGATREDRIRNEYIYIYKRKRRSSVDYVDKIRGNRLRCYDGRRFGTVRTVMELSVKRGKPKV